MKKIVLLLVGIVVACLSFGQTTIWSSDFSNLQDWDITSNNTAGSLNWVITNTKPTTFNKAESNWINAFTAFNSKSLGNYAVVDGTNPGGGTRTAYITTKNSFSTTNRSKVKVSFNQYYTKWQDVVSVEVSTNKTTWTPFVCNSSIAKGGGTTNPNMYSIDISSAAANKSQVWIRFVYAGKVGDYDYAWFVDDVSVEEIVSKELYPFSAFFYSKSSACGLINDKVGFAVINNGTDVVSNGTPVAYKVNNGTEVVETATWLDTKLKSKATFAQGDTALFFFNTPVDLSTTQTYNVTVYTKLVGDGNVANDSAKATIINYAPSLVNNTKSFNEDFENANDYSGGFTAETIDQNGIKFGIAAVGNTLVNSSSVSNCFRIYENNISRVSEDWLYTRCLNLSPDYTYTLNFYNRVGALTSGKNAGKIQTSIGTSPSAASMTKIIGTEKSLKPDGNYYLNTNTFSVNSEGVYYIGFRARNTAADSTINLRIDDVTLTAKGNKADILSFGLKTPSVSGVINGKTITLDVASNTDISALKANFSTSPGAIVKVLSTLQVSGETTNDFKNSVTYVVTSEDGLTINNYVVTVNVPQSQKSKENDFLTYSINGVPGVISGNTITLTLPSGTSLANLSAVYTTSPKSTVTTGANTTNFTNAVTYVVTAEDLTTKTYIVTVNVTQAVKSTACDITSFSLGLTQGVISGNVITLTLPSGSSLTQVATFVLSNGAIAKIGGAAQQSGVTSTDFSSDKVYDVTAEDGTTKKSYTVKVTVAQAPVLGCKDLDNWKDGKNTVEALYPIDSTGFSGNGYFTGTGNYYFQGLHEKFETINDGKNHKLSSVKYVFGNLVSGNDTNTVLFVGYLPDPTTKLPGTTSLFSKRVLVKTVVSSLNNKGEYVLDLSADNLKVNGPFYAGISIRYRGAWGTASVGQDTIAILSNTMGAQGSTLNSAYCNYRNSNKVMVYDTIMPDNARFSLGIYANVCDLSAAKDLLSFNFSNPVGTVSTSGNTITLTLPNGTSPSVLASLVANFTSSPKSTVTISQVSQVSGQTANDFSTSKVYTVTAEDGSTKNYTITVTIQQSQKSTEKDFLTYSINGVAGVISGNTITLTLPSGTSLANLSAVYTTSPKSTVTTGANTTNFTNPVTYVVTAEDLTTKTYIVTVTINSTNPNSLADLISFGFSNPNVTGVISGKNVTLTVPTGTYVKSLVASFVVSPGATVKVSNITQISNGSVIDYSAPVTFVITSQDGKTINSYVVNVNLTPLLSPEKELLSFSFPSLSVSGTITGNTVGVTVPFGTNVSALAATFTTSPNSTVRIGSTVQVSGSSVNNFVNSILYTIVAQDGSIKNYTVVVTISAQTGGGNGAGTITSFALGSPLIPGTISGTTITIEGQAGSDITKQLIVFGIPKGSTLTLNGVVQTSGVSIVDFSNNQTFTLVGADGSKKDYIVKVTIPKKSGNSFTTFGFLETPTAVTTIDTTNKLITVHVPYNAPITKLTSYYLVSPGAVVTYGGQQLLSASTYLSFVNDQTFVVVAENNKTAAYKIHVIVDAQTSGIEEVSISSVDIYPNPSNGEFTCRASFDSYELKVLDVLGNEVYFSRIESNGTDKHVFDISEFGSGIYFASIHMNGISTIIKLEVVK